MLVYFEHTTVIINIYHWTFKRNLNKHNLIFLKIIVIREGIT